MPVRVRFGVSQFGRDPVLQPLRDEMFQTLRFFVNLVPRIIENVVEESFQETVVADHLSPFIKQITAEKKAA